MTNQNYLRGVQESNANGLVTFQSIYPGCYAGRWPHIHFEVFPSLSAATNANNKSDTSQIALPKTANDLVYATSGYEASIRNAAQVTLASDNVFSDGSALELATTTGDVTSGFTATLTVADLGTRLTRTDKIDWTPPRRIGRLGAEVVPWIEGNSSRPSPPLRSRPPRRPPNRAPPAPTARASRPLSITLLGTGTPAPSLTRQSSGYLIEVGTDLIVWDHGPGAHHRLIESGHRSIDVTHAFFTHLHYDHCMDYGRLVLQRWDQGAGRIPELQVYGPTPIARMTEQLFGENGIYAGDIAARTTHRSSLDVFEARGGKLPRLRPGPRVTEIHTGSVVEGNGWKITVAHAQHAQPYLECVALRLDTAEGSICYSGDSGGIADSVVQLAKGCDLFIAMNHFFSGSEPTPAFRAATGNHLDNAEIAKRAGVKTLVLTHLTEQIDQPTIREQIVHEIRRVFDGKLIWGEDLMRLNPAGSKLANIEPRTAHE